MKWSCLSQQSFFAQPPCDLKTLREYEFFLLYHGKGYTHSDVQKFTIEELVWHATKLKEQLEEETKAAERQRKAVTSAKRR
jgi:hypothetical protein